jgi:hypothetical protein
MIETKEAETSVLTSKIYDVFSFPQVNNDCQTVHDVIKDNILANEKLHDSIELLNAVLSTHTNISYGLKSFIPIIAVIIGAFLGYFFNRFHWSWIEKKKKETDAFIKLSTLISELETLSVEYWTKDRDEDDVKNEVYIKSKIRLLTKYVRLMDKKHDVIKTELDNFVSDLYDLVTGDDFESKDRKASKQKAMKISYRCTDVNATILSHN